jgi:hypothetical protein
MIVIVYDRPPIFLPPVIGMGMTDNVIPMCWPGRPPSRFLDHLRLTRWRFPDRFVQDQVAMTTACTGTGGMASRLSGDSGSSRTILARSAADEYATVAYAIVPVPVITSGDRATRFTVGQSRRRLASLTSQHRGTGSWPAVTVPA